MAKEIKENEVTKVKLKVKANFYDGIKNYKVGEVIEIEKNEFFEEIVGKQLVEIIEEA